MSNEVYRDIGARGRYVWNGIHRDAHNSDFCPNDVSPDLRFEWGALEGAAILFGPAIGPGRRRYICTGQGEEASHLHCFSPEGELLYQTKAAVGQPSSRVSPDVPLFNEHGNFFVSDDRQIWCFDDGLNAVWQADLRAMGATNALISTIITKGGHVGGVTMDGQVILLDPKSGRLAMEPLHLPVGDVFPPPPSMPGLWQNGMMDPHLIPEIEPAFFGFGYPVTCSPVVNGLTGNIYIPYADAGNGVSKLAALNESECAIEIAWTADIPNICTSSPAVSPDGKRIHTVNGAGIMHTFDCAAGQLLWTAEGCGMAASPTIDDAGNVYSAGRKREDGTSQLLALDGITGEIIWRRNFDELAREMLASRSALAAFPNPHPTAVANSVPTVTPNHVLIVFNLGYDFIAPNTKAKLHQPHIPALLVLDRANGETLSVTPLRDTSEAVIVISDDRRLHVCHAALMSSVFHYGINPHLPESHRSALAPVGGFSTLTW